MGSKWKTFMGRKEKTIFITIIANIILIVLRFFLANLSGSIGLTANAWHSFTDVFVSTVVFIGLMITHAGAEKLGKTVEKIEHILAIFVAIFIFYMGIEILEEALSSNAAELRYVPFTAAGAFLGVVINYFMARLKIYVGEQTGSQSLLADGYHSKMDMYCGIAVLVGVVGSLFGMPDLDKLAAIVAMVLLMISGYEILTENIRALMHPDAVEEHGHHNHGFHENKKMAAGMCAVMLISYLLSGIYTIKLDEEGVVRRFGRITRDVSPGIHYRLPSPIEEVSIVNTGEVQRVETGVQELLTGDTNLVNINLSVHYRINDATAYLLNVNNIDTLIQSAASTSIRQIVGTSKIDDILTDGKEQMETAARNSLSQTLNKSDSGIEIVNVQLIQADPPESVLSSFQDLATARQDKSIYINEALSYKNTIVPQANADVYKIVSEAESYKEDKIQTAKGDAALFAQKENAYSKSKKVTKFRLYLEAMEKVLPDAQKLLLGADVNVNNAELWIGNNTNSGNQEDNAN